MPSGDEKSMTNTSKTAFLIFHDKKKNIKTGYKSHNKRFHGGSGVCPEIHNLAGRVVGTEYGGTPILPTPVA